MATYLYSRDSKGKVRVLVIQVHKFTEHYEIHRRTGLLDGKLVEQPIITIMKGKVKRTTEQQCELEWKSIVKKQRDKGYKLLEELGKDISPTDYKLIDKLLPKSKTDASGDLPPMLAKDVSKWPKERYGKKKYYMSYKLDGVRAVVRLIAGSLSSKSRRGKNYDAAFTKIFQDPNLTKLINHLRLQAKNEGVDPECITIDGELYIHGKPLQYISGKARNEEYEAAIHDDLEFWVFDYGHPTHTAKQRCEYLNRVHTSLKDKGKIVIVPHHLVSGYDEMKALHDKWVSEGFEGGVARQLDAEYGFGTKDERMIKFKEYQDDEFEIIGMVEGLREEDMCFRCITPDGKEFSAKPMGDKATKYQYIRDIENIIGKMGTVKFFNYTPDGIPFQPTLKVIRDYE